MITMLGKRLEDLETQIGIIPPLTEVTTSSTSPTELASVEIADGSVVMLEVLAIARRNDGTHRAAFKRTGIFYREGGAVLEQEVWEDDGTFKSAPAFKLQKVLGATSVSIRGVAESASPTKWVIRLKATEVSGT